MNTTRPAPAQVQCPECVKWFTPSGFSQHVSRTRDLRCRRIVARSQSHLATAAFPRMAPPPTLSSTWASQVAGEDALGDENNKATQGKFAVTHVAAHALSYENLVDGDELDHDGVPNESPDSFDITDESLDPFDLPFDLADESPDPADIADADAYEELAPNNQFFAMTTPDQPSIDKSPDVLDVPEQLSNDMEAGNAEPMPTVVIEHFPSASAGAPIHGMPCGSIYGSQQGTDRDSIWSPFTSECDWLFARWAKMHGPTTSSVTELLVILEVRTSPRSIFALLTSGPRS